jgi:hypothetical protein
MDQASFVVQVLCRECGKLAYGDPFTLVCNQCMQQSLTNNTPITNKDPKQTLYKGTIGERNLKC